MFESGLVVKRVGNGYLVRSLQDEINDREIDDNAYVFTGIQDLFDFLETHFYNQSQEGDDDAARDTTSGTDQRVLGVEESSHG